MAAAMCLIGHAVEDLDIFGIEECLLKLPMNYMFQIISGSLSKMEGCYLFYDKCKNTWIRSGKTSGDDKDACFEGRKKIITATHQK